MISRNLLILHMPGSQDIADWLAIKEKIEQRAPDIEVRIAGGDPDENAVLQQWQITRPSVVFCPVHSHWYKPLGGSVYVGRNLSKLDQAARLSQNRIPFPLTAKYRPGLSLATAEWGPYVVLKPSRGSHGRGIYLVRTEAIAHVGPELLPADDAEAIVQRYVDHTDETGHLADYRVLTMFGRPLFVQRRRLVDPRPPLEEIARLDPGSIAMNQVSHKRTRQYVDAPEIFDFARRVAMAFRPIPCLGIDIIRERDTGRIFVLEVNPGGNVWQLSSDFTKEKWPEEDRAGAYAQFGALDIAADLLVSVTREHAA